MSEQQPATLTGLGSGDTMVIYDVLPPEIAANAFAKLKSEIHWQHMYNRKTAVPRLVAIQGTIHDGVEPLYRHPADEQPKLTSWTPFTEELRNLVSKQLNIEFNHALIQYYKDGKSNIGEHSDKTLDIARDTPIINLSLGATRTMILMKKTKEHDQHTIQRIRLPHNSIFVLGWKTNREWQHGIRSDKRAFNEKDIEEQVEEGQRISLTFRSVSTFKKGELIYGQGAKIKSIENVSEVQPTSEDDTREMLMAFSQENNDPNFNWDQYYGKGFDSINFSTLK